MTTSAQYQVDLSLVLEWSLMLVFRETSLRTVEELYSFRYTRVDLDATHVYYTSSLAKLRPWLQWTIVIRQCVRRKKSSV